MRASQFLLAIPALVIAAAASGACSSSNNNGGGGTNCATLSACCSKLSGTSNTTCTSVAGANNDSECATELTMNSGALATFCAGSSGSSTGSGGSTGPGSSGSGSSGSHSGSGTGGVGTGDGGMLIGSCSAPPATTPSGFAGPTGIVGSGCTTAETTSLGACLQPGGGLSGTGTDAGEQACLADLSVPDGNNNSCGNCYGTFIPPYGAGQPQPTSWGYSLFLFFEPTPGDVGAASPIGIGPNEGGCVMAADKSAAGQACGKAIMGLNACEFAVCLPICGVTGPSDDAGFNAFFNCTAATEMAGGACATYETQVQTTCGAEVNDSGTGPLDKCDALIDTNDDIDGSAPASATTQADLIGLMCGGADAGF